MAIIGPAANDTLSVIGKGSGEVTQPYVITPLEVRQSHNLDAHHVIDSAGAGGMKAFRIFERGSDDAFLVAVWMDTGAPHEAGEEVSWA